MHTVGRLQEGWRPEEQPIDDAEHRRVGTNAKRQRHDDGDGKSGFGTQPADGVPQVLPERLDAHAASKRKWEIANDCQTPYRLGALPATSR